MGWRRELGQELVKAKLAFQFPTSGAETVPAPYRAGKVFGGNSIEHGAPQFFNLVLIRMQRVANQSSSALLLLNFSKKMLA